MATNRKLKKRKSLPPKPPKLPKISKNGCAKPKTRKTPPTPPTPLSPKPQKPPKIKLTHKNKPVPHKPPTPPHKPKKSKKPVPPPPINRLKSRSACNSKTSKKPIHPSLPRPRQQSHSTITMKNRTKKPPPKQSRSLTKENKNKKQKNKKKRKCTLPPPPPRMPPSPIKPIFNHPTIGGFYSARVHKKKLLARKLPSKPKAVNIYFILMRKIYPYTIHICLQHKLSQILAKLSSMLAGNEEILALITREVGRNDRDRSLSSISKKINAKNGETKTYDQVIRDPIFIYKNQTFNASQTFIQIGYKRDLDKIEYKDIININITNTDYKNTQQNNVNIETPFIAILSCTKQENDPIQLLSPKSPDLPALNGRHSRSKTHNDIPITSNFIGFNALTNISSVLNLQRDNKSRYKDLKKCVENLGYTLSLGVTKQQLICYVNKSIKELRPTYIDVDDNYNNLKINKKPARKRSRSWGGLPPPDTCIQNEKKEKKEKKMKKGHKRYNQSVPDVNCDLICLDVSSTNPTKLEFNSAKSFIHKLQNEDGIESKFSRILRNSLSKKKSMLQTNNSNSEGEEDKYIKKTSISSISSLKNLKNLKSLIQRKLSLSDKESKSESDSENDISYTNKLLQQSSNKEIEYKHKLPSLNNYSRQKERKRKKKKIEQEINAYYSDNDSKYNKKAKKKVFNNINNGNEKKNEIKPRKYREKKEKVSKVPITRRSNKNKASIIVEGYLNTNIGNNSEIKWKKYYYTFNRDRLLCSYLNKRSCDLSTPIHKLSLMHGRCSFKIDSNAIIVTIKTPKKPIIKHFRGTTSSLEKWKRAFLF